MVDQKTELAYSYQMTLSSFLRYTDMPHKASFTSLPSNIMNNAHTFSLLLWRILVFNDLRP